MYTTDRVDASNVVDTDQLINVVLEAMVDVLRNFTLKIPPQQAHVAPPQHRNLTSLARKAGAEQF